MRLATGTWPDETAQVAWRAGSRTESGTGKIDPSAVADSAEGGKFSGQREFAGAGPRRAG